MTLLVMDFEAISTAPWWATKYSFTFLVTENRTDFSSFLKTRKNTSPPLLLPVFGAALPPLIIWNKGRGGLNLPRLASVEVSPPLFFERVINQLMH